MRLGMSAYTRMRPSLGTPCHQPGQARLVGLVTQRPDAWASGAHIGVDQILGAREARTGQAAAHGATLPGSSAQGTASGSGTGSTTVTRAAARALRPFHLWGPVPDPLPA